MRAEEIDALLGGEAQRLADQYRSVPVDFMDGYGWAVTQICRLFPDAVPVIRCKDCKYYTGYECQRSKVSNIRVITNEDDYCSRAERKEE